MARIAMMGTQDTEERLERIQKITRKASIREVAAAALSTYEFLAEYKNDGWKFFKRKGEEEVEINIP